jgi:hypothetical protein
MQSDRAHLLVAVVEEFPGGAAIVVDGDEGAEAVGREFLGVGDVADGFGGPAGKRGGGELLVGGVPRDADAGEGFDERFGGCAGDFAGFLELSEVDVGDDAGPVLLDPIGGGVADVVADADGQSGDW